jgi:lipoprotein-anchoring transpeptidase ErfK/SrfK
MALLVAGPVFAQDAMPPWTDDSDVPLPPWTRSIAPTKTESAIYAEPSRLELRRGSALPGARLPLYGTRRAPGCMGRWLNVGPLAWMCSDVAEFSEQEPFSPGLGIRLGDLLVPARPGATPLPPIDPVGATDDGLPYRYYFAGADGASGFKSLDTAPEDAPDQDLDPGFAVAIVEEQNAHGERWGKTKKGRWIAMRELVPVRPNLFHGERIQGSAIEIAWVVADKANVFGAPGGKVTGTRVRFEKVRVYEEKPGAGAGAGKEVSVRVSPDGETPAWMRARDLARPRVVPPPPDVTGTAERWIDVDLAEQALVAYEGKEPVFATLVSTGKGKTPPPGPKGKEAPPDIDFSTHPGVFRIWVKVFTTKMDNLDKEEVDRHYAIEDVPWVQFFDKAIALHGAFWHRDFGRAHSHGCVNLAPLDARWLFAFTAPHLPAGWSAVLPAKIEQGAVVQVR